MRKRRTVHFGGDGHFLILQFLVAGHVEVHEEAEEDGGVQQQQRGDELRKLALRTDESAGGVHDAEHKLCLELKEWNEIWLKFT